MGLKGRIINSFAIKRIEGIVTHCRRSRNRGRLQNHDFTILSSNCIGGIIYHELGCNFLSPTINLRFDSKDFIKFILNLDYYLTQELVFFQGEEDCPHAYLGDIVVYFVHYRSESEARDKWEQRKKRIRSDNVYVILNDCDGVSHEDMLELEKNKCGYKQILTFTSKQFKDCPHSLYFPQFDSLPNVGYTLSHIPITGEWYFERYFDYVEWLNSGFDVSADAFWKGKERKKD